MGTATVDDRFRAVGATLNDALRIDAVVAEGGFGLVYRATHLGLDRPVALKVLKTPREYSDEARHAFAERFKDEARTVTRVPHPAVVQVLDFGVSRFPNGEEAAWTAMEWVEGRTLEDELRARRQQGGRHPLDAMALLRPIFEAVAVAHDAGIAHRDLKPANIMVMRGKRTTTARLLDFGIAKLMDPDEEAGSGFTRTSSTRVAFSPRYAAPEQLSSARTGPWSDVHALGMILSEVLTDAAGYAGNDTTAVFAEALSPTRPSPAKHRVDVGAWEPVLCKALSMRPDDRYANAGDFLAALDAALPDATHPAAPAGDAPLSATGPRGLAAGMSRERSLASSVGASRSPDAPPSGLSAGGAGTLPRAAPSGTQEMPAPEGSSTLRGVSSAPPVTTSSAGRRGPLALVAGVAAVVVLGVVAIARSRPAAPEVAPPAAAAVRAAPPVQAPTAPPAVVAPTPIPVAPTVADAGAAPGIPVAPTVTDAGAAPGTPMAAPDPSRRRSRRPRTPNGSNTAQEIYDIQ